MRFATPPETIGRTLSFNPIDLDLVKNPVRKQDSPLLRRRERISLSQRELPYAGPGESKGVNELYGR